MKTTFKSIKNGTVFTIQGTLGDADLVKIIPEKGLNAICVKSENISYREQKKCVVLDDQEVVVCDECNDFLI